MSETIPRAILSKIEGTPADTELGRAKLRKLTVPQQLHVAVLIGIGEANSVAGALRLTEERLQGIPDVFKETPARSTHYRG